MAEEKKAQEVRVIVYIGNDAKYWDALKQRYVHSYVKENSSFKFRFITMWGFREDDYYAIYHKLLEIDPNIIYIDVTEKTEQLLDIATLISQDHKFRHIPVVGLIESRDMIHSCRSAGLDFTHIKCPEYHDVVYDPMCLAYPNDVSKPDFAEAKFSREVELIVDFKIISISITSMHVEGNIRLEKGQVIELHNQLSKLVVPSNRFIVKQIYNKNLYYDCMYGYDLDFIFVDEPVFDENGVEIRTVAQEVKPDNELDSSTGGDVNADEIKKDEGPKKEEKKLDAIPINDLVRFNPKQIEKMKRERIAEYQANLVQAKKKHKEWILDHQHDYKFPKTKILLVDNNMGVLKNQRDSLESVPYIVRTQTLLSKDLWVIDKVRPDIIAFKYFIEEADDLESYPSDASEASEDNTEAVEVENPFSAISQLARLIEKLKEEERYKPFVVIFNCASYTSDTFRNTFAYPKVLVFREKMTLKFIFDMAKMHQLTNEKKYQTLVKAKIAQLKKENPAKYPSLQAADFEEVK